MGAYDLEPSAPVPDELLRVLLAQTRGAIDALRGSDRVIAVHEARKACKRARALLRLVRVGVDARRWRDIDRGYRDAARALSALRDADVTARIVVDVAGEAPGLVWRVPGAPERPEEALADAVSRLEAVASRLAGLDLSSVESDTIVYALQDSWRDARSALSEARDDEDPEVVHDWRKTAKRVYHQLQLLEGLWPPVLGGFVRELDALQEVLGDHHDLSVVAAAVDRERSAPDAVDRLDRELQARARQRRDEALRRGTLLFAASPKTLGALLASVWKARGR